MLTLGCEWSVVENNCIGRVSREQWNVETVSDKKGGNTMDWEAPSFVEVKMDAEINAYQDDFGNFPDVPERPTEALVATNPQ